MNKRLFWIIAGVLLVIGFLVRIVNIAEIPVGLNQDEASIGYEAFSLANYGIDRNGQEMPVHFIAWGSGQNALYAYMTIPFIKILGNTALAVRLPMALLGCLTIIIAFLLINSFKIKPQSKLILLGLVVIFPWHIMKSRWGLESNIFPDLIFYSSVLGYFALRKNKWWLGVVSALILGLSVYSYGTSYIFVPILLIATFTILLLKKIINWKHAVIYSIVVSAIAFPMLIFVIINYFGLNSVHLFGFTIPRLDFNRFTEITSVNGNFISNCFSNLINSLKIMFSQQDGLPLNSVPGFGIIYLFSLPFIVYGFVISFRKKFKDNSFLIFNFAALIASFVVMLMTDPNINRINVLWIPTLVYLALGVLDLTQKNMPFFWTLVGVYSLSFLLFVSQYFGPYQNTIQENNRAELDIAIIEAENKGYDRLYIAPEIGEPYIYYLFYTKYATPNYIDKRTILDKNVMFQKIEQIDNVYFSSPKQLEKGDYLIAPKGTSVSFDVDSCSEDTLAGYTIVACHN